MPEGLEAELYRRAAERARSRPISAVAVDERQSSADELRAVLPGLTFVAARRHGKLVLLDTTAGAGAGPTLGLHFGMTGRLLVDEAGPIDRLAYGAHRDDPAWDRLVVRFDDGGALRVNDPRRWARFVLDPDEAALGPDVMGIGREQLVAALDGRRRALKAVLLDQAVIAGLGNLTVDEVLWQAGLSPRAPARSLGGGEVDRLLAAISEHLPAMLARGGSHRGTLDPDLRAAVPPCPSDGRPMVRELVGGRTTVWCPDHQLDPSAG